MVRAMHPAAAGTTGPRRDDSAAGSLPAHAGGVHTRHDGCTSRSCGRALIRQGPVEDLVLVDHPPETPTRHRSGTDAVPGETARLSDGVTQRRRILSGD